VAYASSISPTYNTAHADVAVSNVGDGRGFAGGFGFHY